MTGLVVAMDKSINGNLMDKYEATIQITVLIEFPVSGSRTFVYKRAVTCELNKLLNFYNQFEIGSSCECWLTVDFATQLKLTDLKSTSPEAKDCQSISI